MKKILITGATGFLGSRLVEKISTIKGLEILATGRTLKAQNISNKSNLEYVLGNLEDIKFIDSLTIGVDAIIHTAALSSQMGNPKDFHSTNIEVTKHLLKAAKAKRVKKFIFISSPSVYFRFKHQLELKESDILPKPINSYSYSKREAEKLVESSGIPYIILRPRALIGRGDKVIMPRILRAHSEGRLMRMGDETNRVDITPVSNVVDAIILALDADKKAINQIYNISNGRPELLWPVLDKLLSQLQLPRPTKKISLRLVLLIAKLMELHAKWINGYREPSLTVYGIGTLTMSFGMDITKAKKLLGYHPKQSVQEALIEFVEWYKSEQL
jgi:nucleoside-diphosphate-sugar epimerase